MCIRDRVWVAYLLGGLYLLLGLYTDISEQNYSALYDACLLYTSMCLMHPVYLAVSLTGALAYDIHLKAGKRCGLPSWGFSLWRRLPRF